LPAYKTKAIQLRPKKYSTNEVFSGRTVHFKYIISKLGRNDTPLSLPGLVQ